MPRRATRPLWPASPGSSTRPWQLARHPRPGRAGFDHKTVSIRSRCGRARIGRGRSVALSTERSGWASTEGTTNDDDQAASLRWRTVPALPRPARPLPSSAPATGTLTPRSSAVSGPVPGSREDRRHPGPVPRGHRSDSPAVPGPVPRNRRRPGPAGAGEFGGVEEGPPRVSPATSHDHVRGVEEGPPPA
jgi:hypothetical protein